MMKFCQCLHQSRPGTLAKADGGAATFEEDSDVRRLDERFGGATVVELQMLRMEVTRSSRSSGAVNHR